MLKLNQKILFVIFMIILISFTACSTSSSSQQPKVSPTTYIVKLVCDDCAQAGIEINVWQNAGTSRGNVIFRVPHQTSVNVVDSKNADDGRLWYKVEYNGKTGWIAKDFVNR
ncbi:MAG TPA: SH3 domain-containing protein [Anaerolineales bacterium]|nr:SH3 domain-containing protein [Anaerolineales bacterium]